MRGVGIRYKSWTSSAYFTNAGGDPEIETLLPLMESDLLEVMVACTDNYLDTIDVKCSNDTAVTIIAAASGYPGPTAKNDLISIDHSGKLNPPFFGCEV